MPWRNVIVVFMCGIVIFIIIISMFKLIFLLFVSGMCPAILAVENDSDSQNPQVRPGKSSFLDGKSYYFQYFGLF